MRVVHIADTHLGYRAYNRVTSQGVNRREADVFKAFQSALAQTVQLQPDLILIAGDLFHQARPSNLTIQWAFKEFVSLRAKTNAPVVIVGGNHDSPRSSDAGCILDLLTNIEGVHVAHTEHTSIQLPDLDLAVLCLCHRALPLLSSIKIAPDRERKYNVLLVHGRVEGVEKGYDAHEIGASAVTYADWDYVAYGHLHAFRELAPNAYYSGSIEYAGGLTVWQQAAEKQEKGFIEFDLDAHELVAFHQIQTRPVVDIHGVDAKGMTADQVNQMIRNRVAGVTGGCTDKIVRLVVENAYRSLRTDLDYSFLKQLRADALHFELQLMPPPDATSTGARGDRAARPLELEWAEFAGAFDIPAGVRRDRLVDLGQEYLVKQSPVEVL